MPFNASGMILKPYSNNYKILQVQFAFLDLSAGHNSSHTFCHIFQCGLTSIKLENACNIFCQSKFKATAVILALLDSVP